MGLLSLNDDALILVFSHLYGRDALHASLVSQRLSILASPRIASVIHCSSPSELRRLHRYLLSPLPGGTLRVKYLEQLSISTSSFEDAANDGHDTPPESFDDGADMVDSYYGADFSQAQLIGDILVEAENLKEINLERFHPCLKRDPRIGSALRAISHLINIRLSTLGDDAITDVLQHMKGDAIERLTLSYHVYDDFPLPEQPKSLPPLLSALSSFRNLHTVKLWNFTPAVAPPPTSSYELLPSIRYLRLSEASAPALHMVELCPNLSTLIFSIDREESEPTPIVGSRWPALRRLMLTDLNEADCVSSRLGTVDQLQIADTVSLVIPMSFTQESSTTRLLRLLRITSPVSLYLSFLRVADEDRLSFRMFWREAASMISRLRSLELKLARNISEARRDFEWLVSGAQGYPTHD